MKKSITPLGSLTRDFSKLGFFKKPEIRLKSTMVLPVRSEIFEKHNFYDELKHNSQNSRQLFYDAIVKKLEEGIQKFKDGKYRDSETQLDIVINSLAGFETDDLTINERRLLSSALTSKAEITTKIVPSTSWDIALGYAKMAYELNQSSDHAKEVYFSIKSELSMDLTEHVFESTDGPVSSHN